ncbi:hypothetical protein ACFZB9_25710 [Kitasatospora sp. NPDC008050]|uniref:hypothetical protein n=1 Tax=Kitasatospora sp. NPDC008050 TaxID=3364021 RepID=UPI0036E840F7
MRKVTKRVAQGVMAGALALGGIGVTAGTANANSDTYCQHSTCVTGYNYFTQDWSGSWGESVSETICNYQSAPNSFNIWIYITGTDYHLVDKTVGPINPGVCLNQVLSDWIATGHVDVPVQVYAQSSGNWTYGTNPIDAS